MKAQHIISQLQAVLPKYTEYFSQVLTIVSLTRTGSTASVTTSADHFLSTGDYVYIRGALAPNQITNLINNGDGTASATTANYHDLTKSENEDAVYIEITGATQPEYNGTKELVAVISRNNFKYKISGNPASPATGTIYLRENIQPGYNGRVQITKTSNTSFTYAVSNQLGTPAQGTIKGHKELRISGAVDIDRAIASYTQQATQNYWAYVVLTDNTMASKDRSVLNDATFQVEVGQDPRQKLIQVFSVFVFAGATGSLSGRDIRDSMDDVRAAIFKSILGARFPSEFNEQRRYGVVFSEDGMFGYDGTVYIHEFKFSVTYDINRNDVIDPADSVAWRDFEISVKRIPDGLEIRNIKGEIQ